MHRGVRLRSLAENEALTKALDFDRESMEWMTYRDRSGVLLLRVARVLSACRASTKIRWWQSTKISLET